MRKIVRNLQIFAVFCLFGGLSGVAFGATGSGDDWACDMDKIYESCVAGYYLSDCGSSSNWSGQTLGSSALTAGNTCLSCVDGYECSGGAKCPVSLNASCEQGYYKTADGDTTYDPAVTVNAACTPCSESGATYCHGGDEPPLYTVTLDSNGGSADYPQFYVYQDKTDQTNKPIYCDYEYVNDMDLNWCFSDADYGATMSKLSSGYIPTRSGYIFQGFSSTKNGTNIVIDANGNITSTIPYTMNTTLYAVWKRDGCPVGSYNSGGECLE